MQTFSTISDGCFIAFARSGCPFCINAEKHIKSLHPNIQFRAFQCTDQKSDAYKLISTYLGKSMFTKPQIFYSSNLSVDEMLAALRSNKNNADIEYIGGYAELVAWC